MGRVSELVTVELIHQIKKSSHGSGVFLAERRPGGWCTKEGGMEDKVGSGARQTS